MASTVLVIHIPGLSPQLMKRLDRMPTLKSMVQAGWFKPFRPSFPALAPSVDASILTGKPVREHGILGHVRFDRETFQPLVNENCTRLIGVADRLWHFGKRKTKDFTTAVLFWNNMLYSDCDFYLTTNPIDTGRGDIPAPGYSRPKDLFPKVCEAIGEYNPRWFWGGETSIQGSQWMMRATRYVLEKHQPNLVLTWMPQLEISLQKYGLNSPQMLIELGKVDGLLKELYAYCQEQKFTVVVLSEYGMTDVKDAVLINRILRDTYFQEVREYQGKEYLDYGTSKAFAVVDHQIAHVFVRDKLVKPIKDLLVEVPGIELVLDADGQREHQVNHARCGDLILVATKDRWFSYYWWKENAEEKAPHWARAVDMVRKGSYDPLELFQDARSKQVDFNLLQNVKASFGRQPKDPMEMGVVICNKRGSERPPEMINATEFGKLLLQMTGV